jgi:hypothetical protein
MTANIKTLIQFHDDTKSSSSITLLANDSKEQLPVMSYIITSANSTAYFAQTQSPALWLNQNATDRYDPSSLDTLQRIDRHDYGPEAYFKLSQFYCADVLAEQSDLGPIIAPMTRPKAGSRWTLASASEAQTFLSLVQIGHSIGNVAGIKTRDGESISIRLSVEMLRHHVLSAGATGSGKSNTNVNLILTAQQANFCTLVYDMKPDYCQIDQPNDERLASGDEPNGVAGVRFWALGADDLQANETPISVRACDLDPAKLAQVIFYRPGEELQQEMAEQLMSGYNDNNPGQTWSIEDFKTWLMGFNDAPAAEAAMPFRVVFNKQTFNALRGKITRAGRVPKWIDAGVFARGSARQAFGAAAKGPVAADQIFAQLSAGSVHVIRVRADADGRSYALFLDYAMRKVADLRRDQSEHTPPILHMIDEAADIFKSSNRRLALAMEGTLDEQVRKGRSLSIGFVLSAQSAGDIPERIRHNLNSVIVFRHHQPKILQEVLPIMSDAMREIAAKLQPGEALVQLFKTHGILRCRMHQSPARLFKPGVV